MHKVTPFADLPSYAGAELTEYRGVRMAASFEDGEEAEFERTKRAVSLFDRSDRGLVFVRGKDRATWLHNLITNDVKKLKPGQGCYAFACDVRGRIQFDMNVMCCESEIWLDMDATTIPAALKHFERFLITEDVQLEDATDRYARVGLAGVEARAMAARWNMPGASDAAELDHVPQSLESMALYHCFAGVPGFELLFPAGAFGSWNSFALEAAPAGIRALDALRIEAGIPWLGRDIDDKATPPETGQIERAVNYHKGCYLGQEVIERMRSHNVLPRRLVRLEMQSGDGITLPQPLRKDGAEVGRITSLVQHPVEPNWIGLGYLKSGINAGDSVTTADPERPVTILP